MKKTERWPVMPLASVIAALILLLMPPFAFSWQKGASEPERKAALLAFPQLISEAENSPEKQMTVGFLYAQGIEGRPDYAKAIEWYKKAANAGSSTAMYLVAVMNMEGLGTGQDYAAASQWAQKAVDSGDASGYMLLGMLHESGSGVPQDAEKAARYYGYAARETRDIGARYRLGMLSLEGRGVSRNPQRAMEWLESAAGQGDRHASYQLGYMYFTGTGVDVDYVRSGTWFEKVLGRDTRAVSGRFPDIFGSKSVSGEGYTKSMGRMMKKSPHVRRDASFMLGRIYEKFGDTAENRECAKAYYGMAAKAGHREARKKLAAMIRAERKQLKAGKTPEQAAAKKSAGQHDAAEKPDIAAAVPVASKKEPIKITSQPDQADRTEVAENPVLPKEAVRVGSALSLPQTRVVHETKTMSPSRIIQPAQEAAVSMQPSPVVLAILDMIGAVMKQGVNEREAGDLMAKDAYRHGIDISGEPDFYDQARQ